MKKKSIFLVIAVLAIVGAWLGGLIGVLFGDPAAGVMLGSVVAMAGSVDYGKNIKQLREKLADKQNEMRLLIETAEKEERDFSEEEQKQYDEFENEVTSIRSRIDRLEKAEKLQQKAAAQQRDLIDDDKKEDREQKVEAAFRKYLTNGFAEMNAEERQLVQSRALSVGTGSAGGYTVPEGFSNQLEVAMKKYGGVLEAANLMETDTGNDIPWPTVNDNSNTGAILGENASIGSSVDPTFGVVTLKAYKYTSKPVLVSNEILQDSAFNLEAYLADMLAKRVIKAANAHFTTGDGTSKPEGLTVAGTKGVDAAVSSITYDNLVDLLHSVDPEYRKNGKWMFHDSTLAALRKLKDTTGRPIFQEGLSKGEPSLLLGKPFIINNDMPEIGASARSVLFGDFEKYTVRRVKGYGVKRLVERYADNDQTGFILLVRMDGKLIDAGTNPVKYLLHAAS